jgi:hypothetical protein
MKTARRRIRRFDPTATPTGVRAICDQLRARCPELIPKSDKEFLAMLNAVRHIERYPATDTQSGRPSRWQRQDLLEVGRHLRAILERETLGRISLSSFVGLYVRTLRFPADLQSALERGDLNLQEAMVLARLTPKRLAMSPAKAEALRRETLTTHLQAQGSQNSLRGRVRELLGESNVVSSETVAATVETIDELLRVDPQDKCHLFYEQIKNLFYAMKEIRPEDVDEKALTEFSKAADALFLVINAIQNRRRQKENVTAKFYF